MTEFSDCYLSEEIVCKHVRDVMTAYVNLNEFLPDGVTVVSGTADTDATDLTLGAVEVVEDDTEIERESDCASLTLYAGRAVSFTLSGGESSNDEVLVTVCWIQSDGDTYCRDLRLLIGGRAAP